MSSECLVRRCRRGLPGEVVKNRLLRLVLTDYGKLTALMLTVILLAALATELNSIVSTWMLRSDAESTAEAWAGTLLKATNGLSDALAGHQLSEATSDLLKEAVQVGDIFRFRLWDTHGHQILMADRFRGPQQAKNIIERCGEEGARTVLSGSSCTVLATGHMPADPPHFACAFIPILRNGTVTGVAEIYVDLTGLSVLYTKSFLLCEAITAIAVLLAGGFPVYMVYRKMAEHRAARVEAQFLADHDALTGLVNRKRITEAGRAALSLSRRNHSPVAALTLDLDHFKEVNDGYGHAVGDELLRKFSERIRLTIREEDTVARLGGDEFVVLQVGVAQPAGARALADRLLKAFTEPYEMYGMKIFCTSSIGVAIAPTDATEWYRLLSCADAALYKSKETARGGVSFFEKGLDATLEERRRIESELRRAIAENLLRVTYQPIFTFPERTLMGFESVLNWPEGWPQRTQEEFIPVAEECGLILPIGAWLLKTACMSAATWKEPLKVSVKMFPIQFRQGNIVATVEDALQSSGLAPERLELEVSESLWVENADRVIDWLMRLRQLGVSVVLDDVGGDSSILKYLWRFRFDEVKIDSSLAKEMKVDPEAEAMVDALVAVGRVLRLTITAEGERVSTQEEILNSMEVQEVS
jgi:diguanylate cyclase (GGDEF)-like protein